MKIDRTDSIVTILTHSFYPDSVLLSLHPLPLSYTFFEVANLSQPHLAEVGGIGPEVGGTQPYII